MVNPDIAISQEDLQKLEKLVEDSGVVKNYSIMMTQMIKSLENVFTVTERGLNMTKSVHEMQIKGIDNWFNLVKFLLPIFVTIFTAGLTINIPNFNQFVSIWLGGVASLVIMGVMLWLSCLRGRIISGQAKDIEKLNDIFNDWKKLSEFQRNALLNDAGISDDEMMKQSNEILDMMKKYGTGGNQ